MSRLTVSLPDELHRALKERAARSGITIGQLVAESLEFYGIKSREDADEIVRRARRNSGMSEPDAVALAVSESRAARG